MDGKLQNKICKQKYYGIVKRLVVIIVWIVQKSIPTVFYVQSEHS